MGMEERVAPEPEEEADRHPHLDEDIDRSRALREGLINEFFA